MKVLLLSHGSFAKEVYMTAEMIMGSVKNVDYITLPYGIDLVEVKKKIYEYIEASDQILILCDLFGGSPFMISSQLFGTAEYDEKIEMVTGMNLSMVLEVASKLSTTTLKELKQIALEAGKEGIIDFREKMNNKGE